MIAIDTNLLVYAHRRDSAFFDGASSLVVGLAEGRSVWAIPWPCVHEFLAIVTHPRIFKPPTPLSQALDQVDAWMQSPSLQLLGEAPGYAAVLRGVIERSQVTGPRIHDARVAALCRQHGVRELWSADRDFSRFGGITVRNPLAT